MKLTHQLSVFCVFLFSCYACTDNQYRIEGNLRGEVNNKYIYLQYIDTCKTIIDSTLIQDNRFYFKGEATGVRFVNLFLKDIQKNGGREIRISLPFFLEKGDVRISATYDSIQPGMFLFDNFKVSGQESNRVFSEYMGLSTMFDKEDKLIFNIYGDYLQNKEVSKAYFERGIVLTKEIDSLNAQRKNITVGYIEDYRNSDVAALLVTKILSSLSLDEINHLLSILSPNVLQSATGIYMMKQVEPARISAIGARFTDFSLKTPEGEEKKISDYVGKGNYVLLEFWASWCGPCKKEIPHLKEVLHEYGDKKFQIVAISMDTDAEAWKASIKEHEIPWQQLSTLNGFKDEISKTYRVRGIPTCLLIDPQGYIIHRNARGSWLDRWFMSEKLSQ